MNKNKLIDSIPSILIVVAIFILWEVLVNIQNIPDWLLPPPSEIFKSLYLDFSKLLERHYNFRGKESYWMFKGPLKSCSIKPESSRIINRDTKRYKYRVISRQSKPF